MSTLGWGATVVAGGVIAAAVVYIHDQNLAEHNDGLMVSGHAATEPDGRPGAASWWCAGPVCESSREHCEILRSYGPALGSGNPPACVGVAKAYCVQFIDDTAEGHVGTVCTTTQQRCHETAERLVGEGRGGDVIATCDETPTVQEVADRIVANPAWAAHFVTPTNSVAPAASLPAASQGDNVDDGRSTEGGGRAAPVCVKGCPCGNSCISCAKVCHGGGSHRRHR